MYHIMDVIIIHRYKYTCKQLSRAFLKSKGLFCYIIDGYIIINSQYSKYQGLRNTSFVLSVSPYQYIID